jgi:DNA-binding NarL/FixJ family response regulator
MKITKILVVDDEIIIADDLCITLKRLGYDALEPALNYNEAIKSLAELEIDLVILDINLGTKKSGIDIAHYIKENYNIPFLFLTSYTDNRTLELAKSTMPYAYLVKPFEGPDVLTAIEIALNNHKRFTSNNSEVALDDVPDFTPTEKVILHKIAENLTTKQIAETMFVSESTIKNHRHNITQKLELPATTNSLLTWVLSHKDYLVS